MTEVKVYYDQVGNTLTVWFGNPQDEYISEETGDEVILMKDRNGLQQQVLTFVLNLRQKHLQEPANAWDVLESLSGTVKAPTDWSAEHDHYLYGIPKHQETEP